MSSSSTWQPDRILTPEPTQMQCNLRENTLSEPQALFTIVGFTLVGLLGILGNTVVIAVFARSRSDKQFRLLIFTLALTDLFTCAIVLPVDLVNVYRNYLWHNLTAEMEHVHSQYESDEKSSGGYETQAPILDHAFQDLVVGLRNSVFAVDGMVLLCVALDRYFCICRSTSKTSTSASYHHNHMTGPGTARRISTAKLLLLTLPLTILSIGGLEVAVTVIHLFFDEGCVLVSHLRRIFTISYLVLALLGLLILTTLYLCIFLAVRHRDRVRALRLWKPSCSTSTSPKWRSVESINSVQGNNTANSQGTTSNSLTATTGTALLLELRRSSAVRPPFSSTSSNTNQAMELTCSLVTPSLGDVSLSASFTQLEQSSNNKITKPSLSAFASRRTSPASFSSSPSNSCSGKLRTTTSFTLMQTMARVSPSPNGNAQQSHLSRLLSRRKLSTVATSSALISGTPAHQQKANTRRHRSNRTAAMLFASTVVFYATLLPVVLSHLDVVASGPWQRIYYVNNAANVFLYSILNHSFRRDVRKLFRAHVDRLCSS